MADDKNEKAVTEAKARATFWSSLIIAVATAIPTCSVAGYSVYNANAGVKAESEASTPIINGLVKDIVGLTIKNAEQDARIMVLEAAGSPGASLVKPVPVKVETPKSLEALRALAKTVSDLEAKLVKVEGTRTGGPSASPTIMLTPVAPEEPRSLGMEDIPQMPSHEKIQQTYR